MEVIAADSFHHKLIATENSPEMKEVRVRITETAEKTSTYLIMNFFGRSLNNADAQISRFPAWGTVRIQVPFAECGKRTNSETGKMSVKARGGSRRGPAAGAETGRSVIAEGPRLAYGTPQDDKRIGCPKTILGAKKIAPLRGLG